MLGVRDLSKEEMERGKVLYEDKEHKFVWLGWSHKKGGEVQTNQYLIVARDVGVLLDPGGIHVYPHVISVMSRYCSLENIRYIFYSHQDPDVSSGAGLFLTVCPNAKILISRLWLRFIPHFGAVDVSRVETIPDGGMRISLPTGYLEFIPAHFLHSEGNFCCYDSRSKILFTGDIGASVLPDNDLYFEVQDFERHVRYMEWFHRRYMNSQRATQKWAEIVRRYEINIIAPQHGAIMRGENVKKFIDWLSSLRCGVDLIDEIYSGRF